MKTNRLTNPFRMIGTKVRMRRYIVDLISQYNGVKTYVEPFGGSGSVFFAKEPHENEVYNDFYGAHANFFNVLKDEKALATLLFKFRLVPCSRLLFKECFHKLKQYRYEEGVLDVDAAFNLFYTRNYAFHGCIHSFGGDAVCRNAYQTRLKQLQDYADRFKGVLVECRDFRDMFRVYDKQDALFYCDPPYETTNKKSEDEYLTGWAKQDEIELVDNVLNCVGGVILSCYDNENYQRLLGHGFVCKAVQTMCSCDKRPSKRVETIYYKPVATTETRLFFDE